MNKKDMMNIFSRMALQMNVSTSAKRNASRTALQSMLDKPDKELMWSLGLALIESNSPHQVSMGRGILLAAGLEGEITALNNLAISLEQKGTKRWERKIAALVQQIAAELGDSVAAWNMYHTFRKKDPLRALRWLMTTKKFNENFESEYKKLVERGKLSEAEIRDAAKRRPW